MATSKNHLGSDVNPVINDSTVIGQISQKTMPLLFSNCTQT